MRLNFNIFNAALEINNDDDSEIDGNILTVRLESLIKNSYVKILDVSGLDAEEVICLYNALVSLGNFFPRLTQVQFQLEDKAKRALENEFSQWPNLKLYEKSPAKVTEMQDYKNERTYYRDLKFQPLDSAKPLPDLIEVNPKIILGANTKTREGASTGLTLLTEVKPRR